MTERRDDQPADADATSGSDLSRIEPIRSTQALGDDGTPAIDDLGDVDRVGRNVAATLGSTPAVGVSAEADDEVRREPGRDEGHPTRG